MNLDPFLNKIIQGDCRQVMKMFPSESIDFVMFSPPYFGLRNYGEGTATIWGGEPDCQHEWVGDESKFCRRCNAWFGQLGLEQDWRTYINHLFEVCVEIKRVLKKTGSMYIVIGDTYAKNVRLERDHNNAEFVEYHEKCLMGIPWRLAFSLIEDNWILRNAIVWHKPNNMPESVKNRLTRAYEYVFHFVKSRKYYYNLDAIREPLKVENSTKYDVSKISEQSKIVESLSIDELKKLSTEEICRLYGLNPEDICPVCGRKYKRHVSRGRDRGVIDGRRILTLCQAKGKNPTDLWSIPTKPFGKGHFAVYPLSLCVRPILSSCPPNGVILDPMVGSGTTCLCAQLINLRRWDLLDYKPNEVARKTDWNFKWIGIDVNPFYVELARSRLKPFLFDRLSIIS